MYPILFDACTNCGAVAKTNGSCVTNTTIAWIYKVFGECVDSPKEEIGFILGFVSIGCWVFASFPQLIENYRKKHVEEAISFLFLMFWLLGDSSNLIGCLLTHQLIVQVITAVYYVAMDIAMIAQYLYYSEMNKRRAKREASPSIINDILANGTSNVGSIAACLFLMAILPLSLFRKTAESDKFSAYEHQRIGRTLLDTGSIENGGPLLPTNPEEIIGYTIGCISSIFYLCSRLPQIWKNYKRHGTDGVSIHMFILAVAGNALYGTSILLQDPDPGKSREQFLLLHLPWLIGSLGTMTLDFTLMMQILYYNPPCKKCRTTVVTTTDDEDVDPLLSP